MISLRAAAEGDRTAIRTLLEDNGLATADLERSRAELVVVWEGARIVAVGGLERFGKAALVRSVAVVPERRALGIASAILVHLEQRARQSGISELFLLTQTAKTFFERQGYRLIDRERAPQAVQASEQFRSICPATAACLLKRLA